MSTYCGRGQLRRKRICPGMSFSRFVAIDLDKEFALTTNLCRNLLQIYIRSPSPEIQACMVFLTLTRGICLAVFDTRTN